MHTKSIVGVVLALFWVCWNCPAPLADNLAGYWPFDETSGGVAHEASGQGLNGALVNFPGGQGNWVSGQLGGSLSFAAGAHEYVRVPDFTTPTTSLTLSAWVWADSMPDWATIAANWNGLYGAVDYGLWGLSPYFSLYFAQPSQQGGVDVVNGSESPDYPALTLGQWHYVAVVADASDYRVQFYRDGQKTGSFWYSGIFLPAPVPQLDIGGEPTLGNPNQGYWNGRIDDLALWTRALSTQEITAIYNAGVAGEPLMTLIPEPGVLACAAVGALLLLAPICRSARSC